MILVKQDISELKKVLPFEENEAEKEESAKKGTLLED